ncbi:MAG: hypothetical protein R3Y24_14340 [Eubacteriales bacterium]
MQYVREHGYLEGREELCQYLVTMADCNSAEALQQAKSNLDIAKILIEAEKMSHNKEDLECEIDEIFTLVEIIQKYAPEYQVDEIVKECMDNNVGILL